MECGFDGKGQSPRTVNKFLSFCNPSQVTTHLPSGQNTFYLSIFYGDTILPETFTAELNSNPIANQFSPAPNSDETVLLNLEPGRNTLKLSVNGILDTGREATDTDRLIFITE